MKGAIYDVAVDVRHGSPTFGQYVGAEISAENWTQIWVPVGFLHAYCTLTDETEVIYKVTGAYDKAAERGVIWNDPDIGDRLAGRGRRGDPVGQGQGAAAAARLAGAVRCTLTVDGLVDHGLTGQSWSPAAPANLHPRWRTRGRPSGSAGPALISTGRRRSRPRSARRRPAWWSTPPPIPRSTRRRPTPTPPIAPIATVPAILARLCAEADIPLIHVSTDYVFDGTKPTPYVETDPVAPQGVYGASKLAGEEAVRPSGAKSIILRTAWVYAATGKNFVRTMLTVGKTRDRLTVVADQHGCPTAAADLADAILAIIARIDQTGWDPPIKGIFHAAGTGATTWFGLAVATFEEAARHGAKVPEVEPIATADWPTPAKRPANSRLDCTRLHDVFGVRLPHWRESLTRTVDTIFATAL